MRLHQIPSQLYPEQSAPAAVAVLHNPAYVIGTAASHHSNMRSLPRHSAKACRACTISNFADTHSVAQSTLAADRPPFHVGVSCCCTFCTASTLPWLLLQVPGLGCVLHGPGIPQRPAFERPIEAGGRLHCRQQAHHPRHRLQWLSQGHQGPGAAVGEAVCERHFAHKVPVRGARMVLGVEHLPGRSRAMFPPCCCDSGQALSPVSKQGT